MAVDNQNDTFKKFILFVIGFFVLILGITLILVWWPFAVTLFKGAVGVILALAGLLMLYGLSK
jgi:hypothetical protein